MPKKDLNVNTINNLVNSWDSIRNISKYEETIACMLLEKLVRVDTNNNTLGLFGFPRNIGDDALVKDEEDRILATRRFLLHATYIVRIMDAALSEIGPDMDQMTNLLVQQSLEHAKYNVKPIHYEAMGQALIETVQEIITTCGNVGKFSAELELDWQEFYTAMAYDMIQAHQSLSKE